MNLLLFTALRHLSCSYTYSLQYLSAVKVGKMENKKNLGCVHALAPLEVQGRKSQLGGCDPLQRQTQLRVDAPCLQVAVGHCHEQQQFGLSAALCCPGWGENHRNFLLQNTMFQFFFFFTGGVSISLSIVLWQTEDFDSAHLDGQCPWSPPQNFCPSHHCNTGTNISQWL